MCYFAFWCCEGWSSGPANRFLGRRDEEVAHFLFRRDLGVLGSIQVLACSAAERLKPTLRVQSPVRKRPIGSERPESLDLVRRDPLERRLAG